MRQFHQLCTHAFDVYGNAGDAAAGPRVAREEIVKMVTKGRTGGFLGFSVGWVIIALWNNGARPIRIGSTNGDRCSL
jgi:hypothetical protein